MKPTLQDIRYDPILSNVSVAYKNEEYIAEKVFPLVKVANATGKYFIYDTASFRKEQSLRAAGAGFKVFIAQFIKGFAIELLILVKFFLLLAIMSVFSLVDFLTRIISIIPGLKKLVKKSQNY